jgi:hypothetical protein
MKNPDDIPSHVYYDAPTHSWHVVPDAPKLLARSGMWSCYHRSTNAIYVGGGGLGIGDPRSTWRYDCTTHGWQELIPRVSTRRDVARAVVMNNDIWVMGGLSATGDLVKTVERWSMIDQKWYEVTTWSLPETLDCFAAQVYNDTHLFVMGGRSSTHAKNSRKCWSIPIDVLMNATADNIVDITSWMVMPRLPQGLSGHGCTVIDNSNL